MNENSMNELMEKEPELTIKRTEFEKELQNITYSFREKDLEKNNWLDKKHQLCDLSGGFWGI